MNLTWHENNRTKNQNHWFVALAIYLSIHTMPNISQQIFHISWFSQQDALERKEYKLGKLEERLKTVEYRMDAIKQSMRSRKNANEEISREEQKLNDTLKKQSELQANMIRNMRRKDAIEKQIQTFQEKESK